MSTKKPLVSIIVPVYNVERYLRKCLESLINQTYLNLEILLINDGSTDSSGDICNEYALKDRRIRVFHKPNGGLSSARNYGLDNITGDYVAYVDSDDWVDIDLYRRVIDKFNKHPEIDVVYVDFDYVLEGYSHEIKLKLPSLGLSTNNDFNSLPRFPELLEMYANDIIAPSVWNKIYKRHILEGLRFWEGFNYEDIDYTFFATCKVSAFAILDDKHEYSGYFYNQTNNSSISYVPKMDVEHALYNVCRIYDNCKQVNLELVPYAGTRAQRVLDAILVRLANHNVTSELSCVVVPYISRIASMETLPKSLATSIRYKIMRVCPGLSIILIRKLLKIRDRVKREVERLKIRRGL